MMQGLEREAEPVVQANDHLRKLRGSMMRSVHLTKTKLSSILFHQGFLLVFIGFLLGRALILNEITPFALPFFAAVYFMKKKRAGLTLIALLGGSVTVSAMTGIYILGGMILFMLLFKWAQALKVEPIKSLPFLVFISAFLSKTTMLYFTTGIVTYDWLMIGVEAGLGFILTLIFFQSIPLITGRKKRQSYKTEEIICLIILLASVLTGTIGWAIYDMSIEHIMSRYLVLLFAFIAGATIGSTVGVVTGLILSLATVSNLYQMSLLAFAGLLGGLLREGNKLGVSVGLLLGTLLIGIYGEGMTLLVPTIMESMVAVAIFLITPQKAISNLAKYIPGTAEYNAEQQQYMRKVRDVTANRVEQFSHVFQALSNSFSKFQAEHPDSEKEVDLFLSNVTEKTCQNCFKRSSAGRKTSKNL